MAVLVPQDFDECRDAVSRNLQVIGYTKPQINAALQAVEDWFEANRASVSAAINAATIPVGATFSAAMKKLIVTSWLANKLKRGG